MAIEQMRNAVRALRECARPETFTMTTYVHGERYQSNFDKRADWCGSPGCVLGNYASRTDLQDLLQITWRGAEPAVAFKSWPYEDFVFHDPRVLDHFGIDVKEADELFSAHGCGGARTPEQAATYLEDFAARKWVISSYDQHLMNRKPRRG